MAKKIRVTRTEVYEGDVTKLLESMHNVDLTHIEDVGLKYPIATAEELLWMDRADVSDRTTYIEDIGYELLPGYPKDSWEIIESDD